MDRFKLRSGKYGLDDVTRLSPRIFLEGRGTVRRSGRRDTSNASGQEQLVLARLNRLRDLKPIEIIGLKSEPRLRQLIEDFYSAEKEYINFLISESAANNVNNPLGRSFYVNLFLAIKESFKIKSKKIKNTTFFDFEMLREFLVHRISADLREAFQVACQTDAQRLALLQEILCEAGHKDGVPAGEAPPLVVANSEEIPAEAPMLWKNRLGRHRKRPHKFAEEVYFPWLGKVTRADIRRLDRQLYGAISKWLGRHQGTPEAYQFERLFPEIWNVDQEIRAESRRKSTELRKSGSPVPRIG